MKKMVFFSLLGVFVLLTAWFRLAPSDLSKWHVPVASVEGEEIQTGAYAGMTKREKRFIKMLPGIRQYWEVQDPASKTRFLKANF